MKKIQLMAIIIIALMCYGLTSCSKDNDDNVNDISKKTNSYGLSEWYLAKGAYHDQYKEVGYALHFIDDMTLEYIRLYEPYDINDLSLYLFNHTCTYIKNTNSLRFYSSDGDISRFLIVKDNVLIDNDYNSTYYAIK